MNRPLATFGIILLLIGGGLFIGVQYKVEKMKNVEVTYTEQEAYYIEVDVNKKHHYQQLVNHTFTENWLYVGQFDINTTRDVSIEWKSDKTVFLFCIVTQDFFGTLTRMMGLAGTGWKTGGALGPYGAIVGAALGALMGISGSFNYVLFRSQSDNTNIKIPEGSYSVVQVILNAPTILDSEIFYEYTVKEMQVRYRPVEKTRIESKIVTESILPLPELGGISWVLISLVVFIVGILLAGMGLIQKE